MILNFRIFFLSKCSLSLFIFNVLKSIVRNFKTYKLIRWISKELNQIKSVLESNNFKLVGVGPEKLGSEDFIKGNFWSGGMFFINVILLTLTVVLSLTYVLVLFLFSFLSQQNQ